jgi:hypothetical protein
MINESDIRIVTKEDSCDIPVSATIKLFPSDLLGIEVDIFSQVPRGEFEGFSEWEYAAAYNVMESFRQIAAHFYNLGLDDRGVIR